MPEKSTNIGDITINFSVVISVIMAVFNAYIALLISKIRDERKAGDKELRQDVDRNKDDLKHHREMHEDHYNKINELKTDLAVLKSEHGKNHK